MQKLLLVLIAFFTVNFCSAQQPAVTDSFAGRDISITYSIKVTGNKKRSVAETYNGAIKTLYIKNNLAKLRFVSLMRSQNIYYDHHYSDTSRVAVVVKESGKKRYKYNLGIAQWRMYNSKYDAANTMLSNDSMMVAGRLCRKALVTLTDGGKLTVYYLPAPAIATLAAAEPMFAAVPGIVLQYELHHGKKSIVYTAQNISLLPISIALMKPPAKGYITRKFGNGKAEKDEMEEDD